MSVIANGGTLMTPQVVHQVTDPQTGEVTSFPPNEVRRVIPEKIAAQVREALVGVVGKKGTAQKAHVPGFLVGGKTGTAQKARGGCGGRRTGGPGRVGRRPGAARATTVLLTRGAGPGTPSPV